MDSKFENYMKKQSQLQEKINELFAENKVLKNKISVLSECLSIEKVKKKICELENKQKILSSLESMIIKLRTDVTPLEYLKQTLQKQLISNKDSAIAEQKGLESSDLTVNSGCAIETLDSVSDVSSDESSIIVLSEFDVISDEETLNNTETTVSNKVIFSEALQMAASAQLSLAGSSISNIGSIELLPNDENNQIKNVDRCEQSKSKDIVTLINANSKSEQLLDMYDIVNKEDVLNCDKKDENKLEPDTGKSYKIYNQLHMLDGSFGFEIRQLDNDKYDIVPKCNNDSWVKVNTNEPLDIAIKNEPFVEKCPTLVESQQDDIIPKGDVDICTRNDQSFESNQLDSKDIIEIKSVKHECSDADQKEIRQPVCSINISKDNVGIEMSLLNTEDILRERDNMSIDVNAKPFSIDGAEKSKHYTDELTALNLNVKLLNGIHQHGIKDLMPLQLKCLFHCINRRDVIFHSYPCIGKSTVGFISVLQMIDTNLNECQAIVLVPTLELALSAQKTIKSFGKFLNVSTSISGSDVPCKVSSVSHILISTPCSLFHMINCSSLCKDFIKILIIDDAEEMFDCNGFFNQIRHILLFLNNDRQLIILSTSKLEEILDQFSDVMQNPEYIIVPDEKPLLKDIIQYHANVTEEWKFDAICELYEILKLTQTIVYCDSWDKSLEIAENMRFKKYSVSVVHNEMNISQRRLILRQFRCGISKVLVTTGLLRGEDFSDVVLVINYDLPKSPKEYVRKIVSCFGRQVKVINFVTKNDTTAKDNIETAFNMRMLYLPQDMTGLFISNLNSNNDQILGMLEL